MAVLGFAILGAGVIAKVFAEALAALDDAELRLVVSRRAGPARALAEAHGARWTDDVVGYLGSRAAGDVEAVIVTTPSGRHVAGAIPALEAGRHVLVEKPLDISLAAADRLIEAERRTGEVVGVVSQHRFDPASVRVLQAVQSGGLGRLTSAVASCAWWRGDAYYASAGWRGTWEHDGGGATMNQAVHMIDLMLAVMGRPVDVFARTGRLSHRDVEVEDTAVATVSFAGGALGAVHATTAGYPGVEASLRVYGDGGSAAIVNDVLTYLHVTSGPDRPVVVGPGAEPTNQLRAEDSTPPSRAAGGSHRLQLADFVRVVRARQAGDTTARVQVGTAEGRQVLALVLGMYESARTGRAVDL